jgi:hypothetical protein
MNIDKIRKSFKGLHPAQHLEGPNTEEDVFVSELKFHGAERISSNCHEFAEALRQAVALKFGAIARIIFQAMEI